VGLGGSGHPLERSTLRHLEGVPQDAFDSLPREDRLLHGELIGSAALEPAAESTILPFGILANEKHADIVRSFCLERRLEAWQDLDGAQVHVKVEAEADPEQEVAQRDVVGNGAG